MVVPNCGAGVGAASFVVVAWVGVPGEDDRSGSVQP
jgi:hypothetical protein